MNLHAYIGAAFPALAIETVEEERFTHALLHDFPAKPVFAISASGGLRDLRSGLVTDPQANFSKAFAFLAERSDTLLLVFDWQHVARNAMAYRTLKDNYAEFKARGCCVVLVAPRWNLPPELEHDVPIIQWTLPTRQQLHSALQLVADAVGDSVAPDEEVACLDAAAGLTLQEAENAFALSLVECGRIQATHVAEEKMRLIRSSGYLEVWPPAAPDSVGSLGALKGSLVGQSEANMRAALRLAEAVAPCVLWLDEVEKGVGGYQSSATSDSGVTLGIVGTFLTWQQEHRAPILTIATANQHEMLPAEMTRAGRFDELFFVDVPTRAERDEIARIHLRRFGCTTGSEAAAGAEASTGSEDGLLETSLVALAAHIADLSTNSTGAEIEQCVKAAARRSQRHFTPEVISACAAEIRPLVRTRAAEFDALRSWAQSALRSANTPETRSPESREGLSQRKVSRASLNGELTGGQNGRPSGSTPSASPLRPNLPLRGNLPHPRRGDAGLN